jgi:hypothetical protein
MKMLKQTSLAYHNFEKCCVGEWMEEVWPALLRLDLDKLFLAWIIELRRAYFAINVSI